MVKSLREHDYEERLSILGLTTLKRRRIRGDLISFFKINNGFLETNWLASTRFMSSINCTGPAKSIRGHKKRLAPQLTRCSARSNFLTNRVATHWNNLPQDIVEARSKNNFKALLDSTSHQ